MRQIGLEREQGTVPAWGGTPADGVKVCLCLLSGKFCGAGFGWFVPLLLLAEE